MSSLIAGADRDLSNEELRNFQNPYYFWRFAIDRSNRLRQNLVAPVTPARMNERLIAQQGLFLCQNNIDVSFDRALSETMRTTTSREPWIVIIPANRRLRDEAIVHLHQMNIKGSVLFPDLQGFAEGLRDDLRRAQAFERRGNTADKRDYYATLRNVLSYKETWF